VAGVVLFALPAVAVVCGLAAVLLPVIVHPPVGVRLLLELPETPFPVEQMPVWVCGDA